jgi:hypothetical protein
MDVLCSSLNEATFETFDMIGERQLACLIKVAPNKSLLN